MDTRKVFALCCLLAARTALSQTPAGDDKAKNKEFIERTAKGWQMAEAAAKKLRYRVAGFSLGSGGAFVPWQGKTSSGDKIEGRFSMMPMDDGTTFSRHYVLLDPSLKARTALLDDWTKAGLLDPSTAESTGKTWEELSTRARSLRYTVTGYGVASGADKRESAVLWKAGEAGKNVSGLFTSGTEKGMARRELVVETELDGPQREAFLRSWAGAGLGSADEAAVAMKAWDETAARIAKEGYTATSYRFTATAGSAPTTKVEWRGKDPAGKFINGAYE